MSKFTKRVLGKGKNIRCCLVIGNGFDLINDIVDNFRTVFIVNSGDRSLRKRNVVYRQDFTNIDILTDIDVIFIDRDQERGLALSEPLFAKFNPTVVIENTDSWSRESIRSLQLKGYQLVETHKNFIKWAKI
jgi:hypothetical protein